MFKETISESFPFDSPRKLELEQALAEIDKHTASEGNFIGFINESDETIQFIKRDTDDWLIDVPVLKDGRYAYSLQDQIVDAQVREIVRRLFKGEEWRNECRLRRV